MSTFSSEDVSPLLDLVADKKFIVIGEMHGSRQNAPLLEKVIDVFQGRYPTFTLAFEWPLTSEELKNLQEYVNGGEVPKVLPPFFLQSDGRFTMEHADLLRKIRTINLDKKIRVEIFTFDSLGFSGDGEEAMAEALLAYSETFPGPIIVSVGNMHARKTPYLSEGETVEGLACLLLKRAAVFSIFLSYQAGLICTDGDAVDVTLFTSQIEGPGTYFDAQISIPRSEPASRPQSLLSIAEALEQEP